MSEKRTGHAFSVTSVLIALLLVSGMAYGYARAGQRPQESPGTPTPAASLPTPSPDEVDRVSKELYCPLCTGVRLDNCDLPLCDQMREVIRHKLAAGETKEQIKAYFVEQYGQVVLGVPPKQGGMILAWVLPFLVVLVAGIWVIRLMRRWTRRRAAKGSESEPPRSLPAEYVERLERELEQFE